MERDGRMDDTVLKTASAGFIHDIGKLTDSQVLSISNEFIRNHADLYQPFDKGKGRHTHIHVLYTAAFIEQMKEFLPRQFNQPDWGSGDAFINLAAGHHRPETPMQWVIAIADRLSSGWDRDTYMAEDQEVTPKDFRRTRLYPLFEQLMKGDGKSDPVVEHFDYCYPLAELSPTNIFPAPIDQVIPEDTDTAKFEYQSLGEKFLDGLKNLSHKNENLELWLEHFDSLLMTFMSNVPAARAGKVVPDVSLYDHSRTTAALASAIYLYHQENGTLDLKAVSDYGDAKFLFINGDFYGIQNFIFSTHGDTRASRSKLLRGRSFTVSLITELAADMICRELGLPFFSVLLNAAGKFTILAPNLKATANRLEEVASQINDWLKQASYGETSIGLSTCTASGDDFVSGTFVQLFEKLQQGIQSKKFNRIDLKRHSGVVTDYLDAFRNDLRHPLCPFCGKRPSEPTLESQPLLGDIGSACALCRDHIFLGTYVVKKSRVAVTKADATIYDSDKCLFEPIFGRYQVAFLDGDLNEMARSRALLRHWALSLNSEGEMRPRIAVKLISGYVPVYSEQDQRDERILAGAKSEAKKLELIDQIKPGGLKTFGHIAASALQSTQDGKGFCGIEALAVLKADVDNLGLLISCGLAERRFTISRLATLSRQLHSFFTIYLPHLLAVEPRFHNIYTVFAGGDDLFLIGPWENIIDLAVHLRRSFAKYVCGNGGVTFSAGISIHKPYTPVDQLVQSSELSLGKSKTNDKNQLTLFEQTVTWEEMAKLQDVKRVIEEWLEQQWINNAMLYRLNDFIEMAGTEKRLLAEKEISLADMACTKWRSLLAYSLQRNVAKKLLQDEREQAVTELAAKVASWLIDYGSKLKIPLWEILYSRR